MRVQVEMSASDDGVAEPERNVALVDAHVHFYPCYDRDRFLDAAQCNFDRWRRRLGLDHGTCGVLMLTESRGHRAFESWRSGAEADRRWRFSRTDEPVSVVAHRHDGASLVVIAGYQLRTEEDLEVLALGTRQPLTEGRCLRETLDHVRKDGALPIVPWGFGKWWFRRGRLVRSVVRSASPGELFLGDNGGRPSWYPRPRLFDEARRRGLAVLPGSDPLPFPAEEGRVGSFGTLVRLTEPLSPERPARDLLRALRADPSLRCYGEGETTWRFLRHQLRLQLRKRLSGGWPAGGAGRSRT